MRAVLLSLFLLQGMTLAGCRSGQSWPPRESDEPTKVELAKADYGPGVTAAEVQSAIAEEHPGAIVDTPARGWWKPKIDQPVTFGWLCFFKHDGNAYCACFRYGQLMRVVNARSAGGFRYGWADGS